MPQMAPACWICLFMFISVSMILISTSLTTFMISSVNVKPRISLNQTKDAIKPLHYFWS